MTQLSNIKTLCGGEMTVRSLRPLTAVNPVVVCLPGGPGIGSTYLDPFMIELGVRASVNVGILDLPNHGASLVSKDRLPVSYQDCAGLVQSALSEIQGATNQLFLFGQSFGARVAFDLIPSLPNLAGVILAGFPFAFRISDSMLDRLSALDLEPLDGADPDAAFSRNWSKIFPLYSPKPLPPSVAQALSLGTRWRGNEMMLADVPDIEPVAARVRALATPPPLLILQGEVDAVVPDRNLFALKRLIPGAEFTSIPGAGHFPMVEEPEATLSAFVSLLSARRAK